MRHVVGCSKDTLLLLLIILYTAFRFKMSYRLIDGGSSHSGSSNSTIEAANINDSRNNNTNNNNYKDDDERPFCRWTIAMPIGLGGPNGKMYSDCYYPNSYICLGTNCLSYKIVVR